METRQNDPWPERNLVRDEIKKLAKAKGFRTWPEVGSLLGMNVGSFRSYIYMTTVRPPEAFIAALASLLGMDPADAGYGKGTKPASTQMPKLVYAQGLAVQPRPTPAPAVEPLRIVGDLPGHRMIRNVAEILAPDHWGEAEKAHLVREIAFIMDRIENFAKK